MSTEDMSPEGLRATLTWLRIQRARNVDSIESAAELRRDAVCPGDWLLADGIAASFADVLPTLDRAIEAFERLVAEEAS